MGLWTCTVDVGFCCERAVLVDSVTERPLNLPLFKSAELAESFLAFAAGFDIRDVRALTDEALDHLHTQWLAHVATKGPGDEDDDEDEDDDLVHEPGWPDVARGLTANDLAGCDLARCDADTRPGETLCEEHGRHGR